MKNNEYPKDVTMVTNRDGVVLYWYGESLCSTESKGFINPHSADLGRYLRTSGADIIYKKDMKNDQEF